MWKTRHTQTQNADKLYHSNDKSIKCAFMWRSQKVWRAIGRRGARERLKAMQIRHFMNELLWFV